MSRVVNALGRGGQRFAEKHLGWNRGTIRKGLQEQINGEQQNLVHRRGRKKAEAHLPNLLDDIRRMTDSTGQTDPTFRSTRLYSPLTASEVRRRLQKDFGYSHQKLPCERTLRNKLNDIGCCLRKVRQCMPLKKMPETDAIFNEVHRINETSDLDASPALQKDI